MKQGLIFTIILLLNSIVQCSTSPFLPGTRTEEISTSTLFINDITRIIVDYDTESCLETHSINYYAYVQNAHQWNGKSGEKAAQCLLFK
jgi:hypothetical protein